MGTLVITGVAAVISVPIGIMAAIYLTEYGGRSRLRRALTFFVDVMTGIPSIVAGLFAYALFAIFFGPGIRLGVMGSVALSVLMIPIVIRTSEEVLKIVPNHLREASYALGTPKWRTIVKVVLPTAFAGLITGVMIAVARIIGETAPLLVTTGVIDSINANPFQGRMQNLAVYAYSEYRTPGVIKQASYDRAWAAALLLIVIVMVLNLVARLIYRRYKPRRDSRWRKGDMTQCQNRPRRHRRNQRPTRAAGPESKAAPPGHRRSTRWRVESRRSARAARRRSRRGRSTSSTGTSTRSKT